MNRILRSPRLFLICCQIFVLACIWISIFLSQTDLSNVLSVVFVAINILTLVIEKQQTKKLENRQENLLGELANLSHLNRAELDRIRSAYSSGTISLEQAANALNRFARAGIEPATPKHPQYCFSCKYYYGNCNIVCAVHPSGVESDTCLDFEKEQPLKGVFD